MNADQWGQVADLFQQSVALPEPDRQAFLMGSPYSPEVRDQVARLLVGDAGAEEGGFLQPLGIADVSGGILPDPHAAARRGLHLRCPHCHNQIEVIETRIPGEFTCQLCGKTIRTGEGSTGPIEPGQGETIRWEPSAALRKFGRFSLIHWVGEGGYGIVYKARDPQPLDRIVALKIPRLRNLGSPQDREFFLRDAQAAGQLRHPSIVPIFEVGEVEGTPYIVSEFVEGVTLAELLGDPGPAPDIRESARIAIELAGALQHAHDRRVVHRDVKPSNIMLDRQGRPRLMDFGLAKLDASEITIAVTGRPMGTPAYMSPEQARGEGRHADGRTDIYGLGSVLYFLITGSAPFAGTERMIVQKVIHDDPPTPRSLNERIPRDLQTICQKAMAKESSRRYGSAKDFATDLQNFLDGRPINARPVGKIEKAWRLCARNPRLSIAIGTALVSILAVAIVSTLLAISSYRLAAERTRGLLLASRNYQNLALQDFERGEIPRGLLWSERALAVAREIGDADLVNSAEASLAAWSREHPPLQAVFDHPTEVRRTALSPDGKSLLAACADGTAQLWDVASGEPIAGPLRHGGKIRSVSFHPDGRQVMTASEDGAIRLWDASTGREVGPRPSGPGFALRQAVYGEGGRTIVSLGIDGTFRRWDVATGQPLGQVVGKPCLVTAAAISPDARRGLVASVSLAGDSREVRLWDLASGQPIGGPMEHGERVWAVAFSPDGKMVATGDGQARVMLWDTANAASIGRPLVCDGSITSLGFSPDGTALVAATSEKTALIWVVASGLPRGEVLRTRTRTNAVTFSPDGRMIATAGEDGQARLWDAGTGKPLSRAMPHRAAVAHLAFLPDSRSILTGSGERVARIWSIDISGGSPITLAVPGKVGDAALSPDGSLIVAGNDRGEVFLCKSTDGQPTGPPWQHGEAVEIVAFAGDGRTVLAGGPGGRVQLRRAADGQPVGPVHLFKGPIVAATFSSDGSTAVVGSDDGTGLVIDARSGLARGAVLRHDDRVQRVAVDARGSVVVTGSTDNSVRLWNGSTGAPIGPPLSHVGDVVDLAMSPDGRRLITADLEGPARLWDAASGRPIFSFDHDGQVITAGFSPDGLTALTGGVDAKVRLWDVETGRLKTPFLSGVGDAVFAVAFSADSRLVAIGGRNGNVRLWDASKGLPIGPGFSIPNDQVDKLAFHPGRGLLLGLGSPEGDGVARLWAIPRTLPDGVSGLTGLKLDERDEVVTLDGPSFRKHRERKPAATP